MRARIFSVVISANRKAAQGCTRSPTAIRLLPAMNIAKQLIVLLGNGLVTAVASFYFGANSVASANPPRRWAQKTEIWSQIDRHQPQTRSKPSGEAQKTGRSPEAIWARSPNCTSSRKVDTDIDAEQVACPRDTAVTG